MNPSKAYKNGIKCLEISYLKYAKYWFNIALKDDTLKIDALKKLFSIELSQGRLDKARELLSTFYKENEISSDNIYILNCMYGELESLEMNFKSSKSFYTISNIFSDGKIELELAVLNMQLGDFDIATDILENLKSSKNGYIQKALNVENMFLALLKKDYSKALYYYNRVNKNLLKERIVFDTIYMHILFGLNKLNDSKYKDAFLYDLLINKDDSRLIGRINNYKTYNKKLALSTFLNEVNEEELLNFARSEIQNLNGRYYKNVEKYIIHCDEPIGQMGNELTNDLCVVTLIGTKEIIKMTPIFISDKFNSEGILQSEEIKRKRELYIKNN